MSVVHFIPFLEVGNSFANYFDFASRILAGDGWELLNKGTILLDFPIDWVQCFHEFKMQAIGDTNNAYP